MSRSKWKGPFFYKIKNDIFTISRNSEITPEFLDLIFYVHNGKELNEIKVTSDMLGHKFGEFAFTRAKFIFKKKIKKKRVKK